MAVSKAKKLNDRINKLLYKFSACDFNYLNNTANELSQSEFRVIKYIGESKKCIMREISQNLFIPKNNLTAIVDKLVDKKYVVRFRSKKDRRYVLVELTETGKSIFNDGTTSHLDLSKKLLKSLSKEEQNMFLELLEKLDL